MNRRLLIAATASGNGKTSFTCGLLAALQKRGLRVSACKCGPDYIDPMFHREVLGAPSRNLDLFLCGESGVRTLLAKSLSASDITIIEGAMGFYDGLGGTAEASAHHLARSTDTPVLLIVNARGKSLSLAAEIQGFLHFQNNNISAVLLNHCSERSYPSLRTLVEQHTGLPVIGFLPELPAAALQSRHLGLVTAGEIDGLRAKINLIAEQLERSVDIDQLLHFADQAPPLEETASPAIPSAKIRVAVARDRAFSFLYEDSLAMLEHLGAEIVPFSPLNDPALPQNIDGLFLSGGYPELYAPQLASNRSMLHSIRESVALGIPTIAECGGFMLLCKRLHTADGASYELAGSIDTEIHMTKRLSRFGYVTLTAKQDSLLCQAGDALRAHEFHYSEAQNAGGDFRAQKRTGAAWDCVYATDTLYAGYPHLHLWGAPEAARRFVYKCAEMRGRREEQKR